MLILGLQKMTLLDFPDTLACTVFTGGCNFRCPFCHNAALVLSPRAEDAMPQREVMDFLKSRQGRLEGVCITGGEPTLQADLPDFLREIRDLGYRIKLDTNGYRPDRLQAILEAGLVDMVAMDVKNSPARYGETVGLEPFDLLPIHKSLELLRQGSTPYWLRTTVVQEYHTLEDIRAIGLWVAGAPKFALQSFKDSGGCIRQGLHSVEPQVLEQMAEILRETIDVVEIKGVDL